MNASEVLIEAYERIPPLAASAIEDLGPDALTARPKSGANPIGWLVWHLARVQDHHVSELLDAGQLWVSEGWAARLGMTPDPSDTGYRHTDEQVDAVRPKSGAALLDYIRAVTERSVALVRTLSPAELDRVVDTRWDPPVTLGVRLVSVVDDCLQHVGQANYVRGLMDL